MNGVHELPVANDYLSQTDDATFAGPKRSKKLARGPNSMIEFFRKLFGHIRFQLAWYCGILGPISWVGCTSLVTSRSELRTLAYRSHWSFRHENSEKTIVLPRIMYLFAAFIICCGLTPPDRSGC